MLAKQVRNTRQKEAIFQTLIPRKDHPSADEIYDAVRRELPRVSLGTVYRNLMRLAEEGQIRVLDTGSGQRRFDPDVSEHPHFRCTLCGCVEDVPSDVLPQGVPSFRKDSDWVSSREVERGYLIYVGLCPRCREERGSEI